MLCPKSWWDVFNTGGSLHATVLAAEVLIQIFLPEMFCFSSRGGGRTVLAAVILSTNDTALAILASVWTKLAAILSWRRSDRYSAREKSHEHRFIRRYVWPCELHSFIINRHRDEEHYADSDWCLIIAEWLQKMQDLRWKDQNLTVGRKNIEYSWKLRNTWWLHSISIYKIKSISVQFQAERYEVVETVNPWKSNPLLLQGE